LIILTRRVLHLWTLAFAGVATGKMQDISAGVMSCMRVCRKQALSRVKYYYY